MLNQGVWGRNRPHSNICPDFEWYFKGVGEARRETGLVLQNAQQPECAIWKVFTNPREMLS